MKNLQHYLAELQKRISDQDLLNPAISKSPVGWHIEHSLLTLNVIINALKQSDPAQYKSTFDVRRLLVMLVGVIPRGKVKAPTVVRPAPTFNEHTLQQHALAVAKNLNSLNQLSKQHYFTHPFLGDFRLKPAIRFMKVHTNHHLKIIKDIVASSKSNKA